MAMAPSLSVHEDSLMKRTYSTELVARADCEPSDPANTVTDRLNNLLKNSGDGYVLQLCPDEQYLIQAPILFAHPNQEISTAGYPTGDDRATLVVNGPVSNGTGHTTAVDGTCGSCDGVKLRNIQIDGTRGDASPTQGGANIEMGGDNSDQLIEYVRSHSPRSWSCLHVAEGPLTCNNVTVQYNDIGPCGVDTFQEWADGISMSCRNSVVRGNMVMGATDGGVVVFGSPGTLVENNTIWVLNQTLLGGINMVDYDPFSGDYTGTIVRNNTIFGGFATEKEQSADTKGTNFEDAIVKIGIAIGPRTWFGSRYNSSTNRNGLVTQNRLSGAFSYGIAITSSQNFTVQANSFFGNTSFIGARGPNCSDSDTVPTPGPLIVDPKTTTGLTLDNSEAFVSIQDGDSLTCVLPPNGGDYWPFGLNPSNSTSNSSTGGGGNSTTTAGSGSGNGGGAGGGSVAGIVVGVVVGVLVVGLGAFFGRKWYLRKMEEKRCFEATRKVAGMGSHMQKISSY